MELRRPGVTLELLHLEYLQEHPDGYRYTAYVDRYRRWLKKRGLWMRQVHRAGEKLFVDYSGKRPHFVDPESGQRVEVELFVGVLGASSYTYAEATLTQRLPDFLGSHVRMFRYFGGVTEMVVPDQLRSAVSGPDLYDPAVQRTYGGLARHYETVIVPARPRKPRDKAKVEVGVQVAQRWILARLRHETFFSLQALNERIWQLLAELNARPMKKLGNQSRQQLFARLDQPALKPLPEQKYTYAEWSKVKVHLDYHVEVDRHYYSAPYALVHEQLDSCVTATTVELFHKGKRVAAHARGYEAYKPTTVLAHMPENHRAWLQSDPGDIQAWARSVGPQTAAFADRILRSRPIAQQGLRSALGLMRVCKKYEPARVEEVCGFALQHGARSYKHVARMLKLDWRDPTATGPASKPIAHANVRGPEYFH